MAQIISEAYRALNTELHGRDGDWGQTPEWFIKSVKQFADLIQANDILDYGAGKQVLERALPYFRIRSYDPAVPEIAKTPEPGDLLVSNAVLEHVEPDYLEAVLDDMRQLTKVAAFITVSTFPSSKFLADGRNAHLIIEPMSWWLPKLTQRWEINSAVKISKAFWFFGRAHGE